MILSPSVLARVALVGSLTANLLLAVVYWSRRLGPREERDRAESSLRPAAQGARSDIGSHAAKGEAWQRFHAGEDFSTQVARLRQMELPRHVFRWLAAALVAEQFASRRADITYPQGRPFWTQARLTGSQLNELRLLDAEQQAMLRDMFGDDAVLESAETSRERARSFGGIPAEKVARIERIERDYAEMRAKLADTAPTDRSEKLALLAAERRSDLAGALSAGELEEYQMRNSEVAGRLGRAVARIEVSEAEFRQLFRAWQDHERSAGANAGGQPPDLSPADFAAQDRLHAQVKSVLGEERFMGYLRATEPRFAAASAFVQTQNLPGRIALDLWQLQRDTQEQAARLLSDPAVSGDQRNAALSTLGRETEAKVAGLLGNAAAATYREECGQWLRAFMQPPVHPAPPEPAPRR